jgi:hypothetical protein
MVRSTVFAALPALVAGMLFLPLSSASAAVLRVMAGATGSGSGADWTNAVPHLQTALGAAAPGDEIWVAAGTYVPGAAADESVTFQLRNGVALYGGFDGHERHRFQRDWTANETILSGDVGGDDEYGAGVWYVGWDIHTANSAHVVTGSGTDATAILDGFTVTAGHTGPAGTPAGSPAMYGSGLYNVAGSPTVRNCTFRRNLAAFAHGGAIYNQDSSPSITACRFVQNWVHLGSGAGIFNTGTSQPVIADCEFVENRARSGSGGMEGQGAGISSVFTPPLDIVRSTFERNAVEYLGGIELPRGGAVSHLGDGLTIRDCAFRDNTAAAGGAVYTWGATLVVNSVFSGNTVQAVSISGVSSGGYGGAFATSSQAGDVVTLADCTVAGNHSGEGAVYGLGTDPLHVRNSVLWGNTATGQDLTLRQAQVKGNADFAHSCVAGLLDPVPGEDPPDPLDYPGCIQDDPTLADVAGGDLHLLPGSPCIDTGDNTLIPSGVTNDLDGADRIYSTSAPLTVDMGAYEQGSPLPVTAAPEARPAGISLRAAPNPMRSRTEISYSLDRPAAVRVAVFDVRGREVARLADGAQAAGPHRTTWDGWSAGGERVGAGIYFIRVSADGRASARRVVVVP